MKENKTDEKLINDLQPVLRSSRWNKSLSVCDHRDFPRRRIDACSEILFR